MLYVVGAGEVIVSVGGIVSIVSVLCVAVALFDELS